MILAKEYPLIVNRKVSDMSLNDVSSPTGFLRYTGEIDLGTNVNFGNSVVEFNSKSPQVVENIEGSGSQIFISIGEIRITGYANLRGNSQLKVLRHKVL